MLNIKSNEIEIIVQDNSDDNLTSDLIKSLKYDFRLVYNHTRGDLKMVNNFSIGLELSKGEYVTFIGDDDAWQSHEAMCSEISMLEYARTGQEQPQSWLFRKIATWREVRMLEQSQSAQRNSSD